MHIRCAVPCVTCLAVALCCVVRTSLAQETNPQGSTPLRVATDIVKIETGVVDARGNFVEGLTQNDFRVLDNGAEQPVSFFASVEAPARVLVLVETSPAVYLIHTEHLAALYSFFGGLAPDDQVALAAYDQTPRPVLLFTTDKNAAFAALGGVQFTIGMGDLNFYDSVSWALDWLKPLAGKKSLLVITTGLDSSPASHWEQLGNRLRSEDTVIFAVGLGASLRSNPDAKTKKRGGASPEPAKAQPEDESPLVKGERALRTLATATGGQAFFPDSPSEYAAIYRQIAGALRHQYVLGIAPAHDGQFHKLTVEAKQDPSPNGRGREPRVFVREGYLAPGP